MKTVMNKNKVISIAVIALVTVMSQSVMAKSIDDKQANQKHRIFQGVKSGELTGKETWRLGQQQKVIYKKENRFKSDGNFTRRERAVIHHDLLKSSGSIYKQKHDRQKQTAGALGVRSKGINKRQSKQARRIGQGIRSGALTWNETKQLGKQQAHLQHQKRRFKADGTFTRGERLKVHHNQNRLSKNIYRKKHNGKVR